MNRNARWLTKIVVGIVIPTVLVGIYLFSTEEVDRFDWPATDYTVVVSKKRYESLRMRAPGDASGASGFVEIFNRSGESFGRVPVPMIWLARDIDWTSVTAGTPDGAKIPLVGEWDFKRRTCFYWSEDQRRQIWVRR